jgi:hypothetical protein
LLAGLAVLQVAWFVWFLAEPLPNAGNVGGVVRRWVFLARAFPQVVPGVRFEQSYFGMALGELSHVEYLPQRVPIVLGAALIAGAAVALGMLVLRALRVHADFSRAERPALAFGLGMTGLGILTLLAGRMGWLAPWPVRAGLAVPILMEGACLAAGRRRRSEPELEAEPHSSPKKPGSPPALLSWVGFALVAGPFLVVMALGAMLPTIDFDSIEYHLQGPKEYYQAGRIAFLPHNVYTSMPFSVEMLHLLGMEVLDDWWSGGLVGQLLVALYAPATAAMVALTARRWASPRAAWVAAVVYLTTPWVYRIAVIPYVEGPLCYYHAALVWLASRAAESGESSVIGRQSSVPEDRSSAIGHRPSVMRLWLIAGLFAGGAMACKYPALISAVVPFGAVALVESVRRRSAGPVLAFTLGWAVVMAPWLGKNVIDTGNPVYPLAYRVFGGRHWDRAQDAKWLNGHARGPVSAAKLGESVVDVAGRSDWQSPLYVALAPLALLRPGSRRRAAWLWGYIVYLFLTWWLLTHRVDRFWLPMLPALAVLAGLGADWVRHWLWTACLAFLLALAVVTNLAFDSTALAGLNEWTGDLRVLRTKVPAEFLNPPLGRLDAKLPAGSKVLLVGQAAVFHFRHPIVYNTVFDKETIETLTRGRTPGKVRDDLRRLGVTHVYVDWYEIERYRSPGNYGFTDYVTPELFARLVKAGVLEPPVALGPRQELFQTRFSDDRSNTGTRTR